MAEKKYSMIGTEHIEVLASCNVCAKDVNDDPAKSHSGFCAVCQKETKHVIPFHGCPWHCVETHANDGIACCICGKAMEPERAATAAIRTALGASRKRMCMDCDPLESAIP